MGLTVFGLSQVLSRYQSSFCLNRFETRNLQLVILDLGIFYYPVIDFSLCVSRNWVLGFQSCKSSPIVNVNSNMRGSMKISEIKT